MDTSPSPSSYVIAPPRPPHLTLPPYPLCPDKAMECSSLRGLAWPTYSYQPVTVWCSLQTRKYAVTGVPTRVCAGYRPAWPLLSRAARPFYLFAMYHPVRRMIWTPLSVSTTLEISPTRRDLVASSKGYRASKGRTQQGNPAKKKKEDTHKTKAGRQTGRQNRTTAQNKKESTAQKEGKGRKIKSVSESGRLWSMISYQSFPKN